MISTASARTRHAPFRLPPEFRPVPVRARLDGWTPERQVEFLRALAESGCVTEAAEAVGMRAASAYRLAKRPDAQSFRLAWKIALDFAVERLSDAVLGRAIHGVSIPHFFGGEQVGEHRRYDNRLAMFILGKRMPHIYGKDAAAPVGDAEQLAQQLGDAIRLALRDAVREMNGEPRQVFTPEEMDLYEIDRDATTARWAAERQAAHQRMAAEGDGSGGGVS